MNKMKLLIITTKAAWYDEIRSNCTTDQINCPALDKTIISLKKTKMDVFGMEDIRPLKLQLTKDRYVYVMACIYCSNDFIAIDELRDRQDLIGAFVQDVLTDFNRIIPLGEQPEIRLVAHDKDLFDLKNAGERFFTDSDLIADSKLASVKDKFCQVYGYIHKGEPEARRIFPIIRDKLAEGNLNDDIIELIEKKLNYIVSRKRS